jgi:hypothetical protein
MTVAYEGVTLTVRAVKRDRHHGRLLLVSTDEPSESIISCLFVPLPGPFQEENKKEIIPEQGQTACPLEETYLLFMHQ